MKRFVDRIIGARVGAIESELENCMRTTGLKVNKYGTFRELVEKFLM